MVSSASIYNTDCYLRCIHDRAAERGGSMPRSQTVPRSHDFRPARTHRRTPLTSVVHISRLLCLLVIFIFFAPVGSAHAMPQLWLPTPAGEAWKVLQGY